MAGEGKGSGASDAYDGRLVIVEVTVIERALMMKTGHGEQKMR